MKKVPILVVAAAIALLSCQNRPKTDTTSTDNVQEAAAAQADSTSQNPFEGIVIPDLDRNNVNIAAEIKRHKICVLDFWASWCGPCRQEMPNMVSLYQQWKDKGLGIIGISLDNDYKAWRNAIEELGIYWMQVSELRGWDEHIAQLRNVEAIPHTIIVDSQGNILAEGLRGEELQDFIKKQLQ
ncbi:MAG: redoxin domain-containing protein [Prevotella sp.]|nr:redoxin domain-containing protein [Prevotella sp.]